MIYVIDISYLIPGRHNHLSSSPLLLLLLHVPPLTR